MFRSNKRSQQPALGSTVHALPEKLRQRLENSWAGTFRTQFFSRIKEEPFAVLYAETPSRPNTPVNVLVGMDTLKAGFGWSDEELFDHVRFDLQTRYALGYDSLDDGGCDLRTLYSFRRRLSHYHVAQGVNLLQPALADMTDQQIAAWAVATKQQRMDSTQIASNILWMSRLRLVLEAIHRLHRVLNAADRERYADLVAPYVAETAGHYVYRVKGWSATTDQLQPMGQVLYDLLQAMADGYSQQPAYRVVARLFAEQFQVVGETVQAKPNDQISASSLQSLDDVDATYREKNHVPYKGYVANVTETCAPQNPLQLITGVNVAPNDTDDSALLVAVLPELKQRTDLDTLHSDAPYGGPQSDVVLREQQVALIQTGICGSKPSTSKLHLADFAITQDAHGLPLALTCPQGQAVPVIADPEAQRFLVDFPADICTHCPLYLEGRCPPQPDHRRRSFRLSVTQADVDKAQRHRRSRAACADGYNLRAAIEATIRSIKQGFPASKLPVRGLFRVTCMIIGAAAMTNVRRIQRYLVALRHKAATGVLCPA